MIQTISHTLIFKKVIKTPHYFIVRSNFDKLDEYRKKKTKIGMRSLKKMLLFKTNKIDEEVLEEQVYQSQIDFLFQKEGEKQFVVYKGMMCEVTKQYFSADRNSIVSEIVVDTVNIMAGNYEAAIREFNKISEEYSDIIDPDFESKLIQMATGALKKYIKENKENAPSIRVQNKK